MGVGQFLTAPNLVTQLCYLFLIDVLYNERAFSTVIIVQLSTSEFNSKLSFFLIFWLLVKKNRINVKTLLKILRAKTYNEFNKNIKEIGFIDWVNPDILLYTKDIQELSL